MEILIGFVAVVVGLLVLWMGFIGAVFYFALASQQGFIGLAAFLAVWVFLAPIMAGVCVVTGILIKLGQI